MLFNSCAISYEFLVLYVYGKIIKLFNLNRIITLDIKDLRLKLPIQNILSLTKFWLNKYNNINNITEQTLYQ